MKNIFSALKKILKFFINLRLITVSIAAFFLFFSFYNKFLVNASTYSLSAAMREFSTASDPTQMIGFDTIITNALSDALASKKIDESDLVSLEAARAFLSGRTDPKNRELLMNMIQKYANEQSAKQGGVVKTLDQVNYNVNKLFSGISSFFSKSSETK